MQLFSELMLFLCLGEEDTVSFIDLPSNNLSKLPEKGILKKSGPYGTVLGDVCKEKWSEDSQSDNQEILSQSDNNMGPDMMGGGAISSVERTLKSLNGYHEDVIQALRNASLHRGVPTPSGSSSLLSEEILRKSLGMLSLIYRYYTHRLGCCLDVGTDKVCKLVRFYQNIM
jgi:hypothetical protein